MKKNAFFVFLLFLWVPMLSAQSPAGNPYDMLSRVLTPIASVFSPEAQQHALSTIVILEEMTDISLELVGTRWELLLQPPDRFLVRGMYGGQLVTICREGESVWITPNGPPMDGLMIPPASSSKKKKGGDLGQMVLPFPPQQLALLPMIFQVKDAGNEKGARVLDVKMMPELARGLGVDEWSLRLGLNPEGHLTRLGVVGPLWRLGVRVERLDFAKELPAATWQAPAEAIRLNARQVLQWVDSWERQLEAARPKVSQ